MCWAIVGPRSPRTLSGALQHFGKYLQSDVINNLRPQAGDFNSEPPPPESGSGAAAAAAAVAAGGCSADAVAVYRQLQESKLGLASAHGSVTGEEPAYVPAAWLGTWWFSGIRVVPNAPGGVAFGGAKSPCAHRPNGIGLAGQPTTGPQLALRCVRVPS